LRFDPETIIKQTIDRYGDKIFIACSFGKASTIVLHMALKYKSDIKVIFENTGCQPKEIYNYKQMIVNEWNVDLIETVPHKNMTFWKLVKKFGLPTMRKNGGSGSNAPRCCYYLKERPAEILYKKHATKAVITGIMANENYSRRLLQKRYDNHYRKYDDIEMCAQRYFAPSQNLWKIHPIMHWTQSDLIEYQRKHNIPQNEFYSKWGGIYKRSGCLPCTAYSQWEKRLSVSHPKLYSRLKGISS